MQIYGRLVVLSLLAVSAFVVTAAFAWLHLDIRSLVTHSIFFPQSNVHHKDVDLAVILANETEIPVSGDVSDSGAVAFLFMIKDHLVHEEYWRFFFDNMSPDTFAIYVHATTPGAHVDVGQDVTMVPHTPSAWCELMAVEMALFKAAVEEPDNEHFILLSHDALPLVHASVVQRGLLPGQSSLCPAGSPAVDVPWTCNYYGNGNIFLHPRLLVKHHQWAIFARRHVEMLLNEKAVASAKATFLRHYIGMPACSDEVMPLLILLAFHEMTFTNWDALGSLGVHQQCPVFAFWNGCYHDSQVPTLQSLLEPTGKSVRWMFARKTYRLTQFERDALQTRLLDSDLSWLPVARTTSPHWRPGWRYPLLYCSYWLKSDAFLSFVLAVVLNTLMYSKAREFFKDDWRKLSPTYVRQLTIFGSVAIVVILYIILLEIFLVDAARHSF
mmetsp:Transcript_64916/g.120813  ORF Transcript_64916/g.120813 Transcript_64916/m.120813 type:complete len:440 (-) Transcript_64916:58-1377(-)